MPKPGMLCPVCRVDLMMTDRQGVEIDYCPRCRGVWLDRGELDKIIERSAETAPPPRQGPPPRPRADEDRGYAERAYEERRYHEQRPRDYAADDRYRRKRKSWLGEIFDFD